MSSSRVRYSAKRRDSLCVWHVRCLLVCRGSPQHILGGFSLLSPGEWFCKGRCVSRFARPLKRESLHVLCVCPRSYIWYHLAPDIPRQTCLLWSFCSFLGHAGYWVAKPGGGAQHEERQADVRPVARVGGVYGQLGRGEQTPLLYRQVAAATPVCRVKNSGFSAKVLLRVASTVQHP